MQILTLRIPSKMHLKVSYMGEFNRPDIIVYLIHVSHVFGICSSNMRWSQEWSIPSPHELVPRLSSRLSQIIMDDANLFLYASLQS